MQEITNNLCMVCDSAFSMSYLLDLSKYNIIMHMTQIIIVQLVFNALH